ncbi:Multi antimicrobial extrusion protein [Dioscorea alata]|uniref:Multi antimicrobial extrusion protein n=2 Tax=Dioscorea alata TaxID=55571 RepID=A0ACB7V6P9_DIOAL|nr:Multi antimicrobial extrusion protein [Dioscorea alata]KAH7669169.1 Multi antimicrobial extrusion protein [Dioscorea alata]
MKAVQQNGLFSGLAAGGFDGEAKNKREHFPFSRCSVNIKRKDVKGISSINTLKSSYLVSHHSELCSSSAACKKRVLTVNCSQSCSDYDKGPYNANTQNAGHLFGSFKDGILKLVRSPLDRADSGDVKSELVLLALPAVVGQALDPLAQLLETAYIGRLGPLELASAGISISIFNIISKIFNVPLLSVTTSFVAEDIAKNPTQQHGARMRLPSVSTALLLAAAIGTIEALALYFGAGIFLSMMGISTTSPMRYAAQQFLSLRALGAPAVVITLAVQGVFRGFKDTKTPLLCIGLGNLSSVILLPLLVYNFRLGIIGAAFATIASQYITTLSLMWCLSKRAVILPPKFGDLQFEGYMKSGGYMLGRTLSILLTLTFGTSMAAQLGPLAMAAHQICLQVWLAVSLLSDALAVSAQALIASSIARFDYDRVKEVTYYVLKLGVFAGIALAIVLSASYSNIAELFTKDAEVLQIVKSGVLFVCITQPINSLAFIFDGLHYGVSDFSYAAYSSMMVGVMSSICLLYAPSFFGIAGVWLGLTLLMVLRMVAGIMRLYWKGGPWWFLQSATEVSKVTS